MSQADALGAAEGLVRRMLEGALHGHHYALALAEADSAEGDAASAAPTGAAFVTSPGGGGIYSPNPSGRTILKLRESEEYVKRLTADKTRIEAEHASLQEEHKEVGGRGWL